MKKRILIVEDETIVAEDIRGTLLLLGHEVPAIAASGDEAIEKIAEAKPDLVLMDIVLRGEKDGIQTAEDIRSRYGIPVVYLTAYSDEDTFRRALGTDPCCYLLKPFEPQQLHHIIEMCLYKHTIERKLKKSEERFRLITEHSQDISCLLDPEGNLMYVSPACREVMGYAQEEVVGASAFSFIHPDDREEVKKSYDEVLKERKGKINSIRCRHKNGDWRILEASGSYALDVSGNPHYGVVVARDVTERKKKEKALRENEQFLKDILNSIQDGISVLDTELNILSANPIMEKWYAGNAPLVGKKCYEAYHGRTGPCELCPSTRTLASGKPDFETVPLVEGGVVKGWLEVYTFPLMDSGTKRIKGVIEYVRDISERRRAEEFVKNILEIVDEGFIVIDQEYKVVSANRAYCSQVNMPFEDIIGRHCFEVSHHFTKPCYEMGDDCAVKHTFETGDSYTALHVHRDAEGGQTHVETKAFPMKDAAGNIIGAIEIINNITERKKLEDQLRHAQKMEAVGQLAGGIAHDFNNILTAIIGYANLLQLSMKKDDPMKLYVEQILASSDRAAHLTQGLLTFSRKQLINPKPMNINDTIKRVEKLLSRLIGEDIELRTKLADEGLTVMADYGQIDQVLMNLATNARDAMPDGGKLLIESERVRIDDEFFKAHNYGEPGDYARISITDTGLGMSEETRKKIFEPFFTTKESGKGTGLGLAIVYGIVKQNDGYINVYSEPGKGATFRIYLPLIPATAEEAKAQESEVMMQGTETVLLAEDDEAVRELTRTVLERFGYAVLEARNGQEALHVAKQHEGPIHLLITDVVMPGMSGRELSENLSPLRPDMKTLFMSGYTDDSILHHGILESGGALLQKPFTAEALASKVRQVLETV